MIDQGKKKKTSVNFVNILGVLRVIHFNPQQKKIVAVCSPHGSQNLYH